MDYEEQARAVRLRAYTQALRRHYTINAISLILALTFIWKVNGELRFTPIFFGFIPWVIVFIVTMPRFKGKTDDGY